MTSPSAVDKNRLAELDRMIAAAEDGYWKNFRGEQPGDGRFLGSISAKAGQVRTDALQDQIDLLMAKRANVAAGLPEDTGIKAPIDLEALVERRFQQLNAHWEKRFHTFAKELGQGLGTLLDERIGEAGGLKYAGTWQRVGSYVKGSVVTFDGSAWVAVKEAGEGEKPGASESWQLMVKRGKDA
jgi:hypothetical protein